MLLSYQQNVTKMWSKNKGFVKIKCTDNKVKHTKDLQTSCKLTDNDEIK